jgi:hypothetical protein
MSAPRFIVEEVFAPAGRAGPLVVGRVEGTVVERGAQLVLVDEHGRATVEVLAVEFATPRGSAEGTTTLVLSSDLDGRVRPGVHLTPHPPASGGA